MQSSFAPRKYSSQPGNAPDKSLGSTFGAFRAQQKRDHERAERERVEREEQNQLTEEQREEIKEAVSNILFRKQHYSPKEIGARSTRGNSPCLRPL